MAKQGNAAALTVSSSVEECFKTAPFDGLFVLVVVMQFDENLDQWPHLNELVHCYTTDWVKDENKYGHYESVGTLSFHNQIYEGPDTDIETGIFFFPNK